MAFKGWYSKQDVIKDLSKASGTRVSDLDEEYVVIGDQPPPPYRTDDSEDELQLLRLNGGYHTSTNTDIVKPDLNGIVQFLRMVDEYNDSPVNNGAKETNIQDMNTVISISKLNPNVVEFVPRSNNDIENVANKDLVVSDLDEKNRNLRTSEYNKSDSSSINTLSNKSISESDEIKEMREKLKTKITSTSNTSCAQVKKERNLAMAMLIKLHTQPNDELTNNVPKPKLMTPDYFKTSLKHDAKVSNLETKSLNTPMELDVNVHQKINTDTCEDAKDDIRTDNLTNISNSRDLLTNTEKSDDIAEGNSPVYDNLNNSNTSMTKEIKESIQKVDDWLNPKINADHKTPATTRPSNPFGPITYKRKNTTKPVSPISVESERKSQNSKQSTDVFVPSTFANELTKKYEERNKVKEIQDQSANIWSKLEYELKVRDEIIKKKLQGNAEQ